MRRCVRTVSALTGEDAHQHRRLLPGRHAVAALRGAVPRDRPPARAADDDRRRRRRGRHPVGRAPHGARGRELRQPAARAGRRGQELVRDARARARNSVDRPRQRSVGSARRCAGAAARGAHDGELGRRRRAGAGPAARRALSQARSRRERLDEGHGRRSATGCVDLRGGRDARAVGVGREGHDRAALPASTRFARSCRTPRYCGCRAGTSASSPAARPRRCGSAPWSSWARGRIGVEREFIQLARASDLRLRAAARASRCSWFPASAAAPTCGQPFMQYFPNRRLISFDAPGAGRSSTPLFPVPVASLAALAAAVLDNRGVECTDVIGFSYGGADRAAARVRLSRARPPARVGRDELRARARSGARRRRWP